MQVNPLRRTRAQSKLESAGAHSALATVSVGLLFTLVMTMAATEPLPDERMPHLSSYLDLVHDHSVTIGSVRPQDGI
jgi:hypothetical protein